MDDLKRNIIKLSIDLKQKNLLLNLSNADLVYSLIKEKSANDYFVLSTPECGICLFSCIESLHNENAEENFHKNGINYYENYQNKIFNFGLISGYGLSFSIGLSLSCKNKIICVLNDFEFFDGKNIEALNWIKNNNISNIEIHCNIAGYKLSHDIFTHIQYIKNIYNNINFHIYNNIVDIYNFLNIKNPDDQIFKYEDILT